MKNIHVLPTDKPSRLQKNKYNNLFLSEEPKSYSDCTNQNIYITNDEEIKEGDWFYNTVSLKPEPFKACENGDGYVNCSKYSHYRIDCKKIILTTDTDLIKDGVQAIDDEFLEWFVKNPSCEFVEVEHIKVDDARPSGYKITIPKEEPKQETLEEASSKYGIGTYPSIKFEDYTHQMKLMYAQITTAFENGAKWQQQQNKNLYSEDDLKEAFFRGCYSERKIKPIEKCWEEFIEQFKKK